MIPTFEYRLSTAVDLGPASRAFVEAIIKTRRFYRNAKSQILFVAAPDDFIMVTRKSELLAILIGGDVIKLTGDPITPDAEQGFWCWLNDWKYKIPNIATYRAAA